MSCRHTVACFSVLLFFGAVFEARAADLKAGLKERINKTQAEVTRLEAEKAQSEKLLANGEALLARAQEEKDQEAAVVVKRAMAKAQQAIATNENSIAGARARIEALTGALTSVEAMPAPTQPVIPPSVVDLRDVKDFTIDPAEVGGYTKTLDAHLNGEKARSLRTEVQTRAAGRRGGNLATMSYAELIAGLDDEAEQGLKQGEETRQKEAETKLRAAMKLPANAEDELLDSIFFGTLPLPPEAKKDSLLDKALGVLRHFDLVRNEEKERMWEVYQNWKVETEAVVQKVRDGKASAKEYEDESRLADQKFLFLATMIGKVSSLSEDEEIGDQFPESSKRSSGGTK
jgi:hypothetical protein